MRTIIRHYLYLDKFDLGATVSFDVFDLEMVLIISFLLNLQKKKYIFNFKEYIL